MVWLFFGHGPAELLLIRSDTAQAADLLLQWLYLAIEILHQHTLPANKHTTPPPLASVRPHAAALPSTLHLETYILHGSPIQIDVSDVPRCFLQWMSGTMTGGASPPSLSTHTLFLADFLVPFL